MYNIMNSMIKANEDTALSNVTNLAKGNIDDAILLDFVNINSVKLQWFNWFGIVFALYKMITSKRYCYLSLRN